ncbi:hypothetical protein VPH35_076973 [Triticum aestivum]
MILGWGGGAVRGAAEAEELVGVGERGLIGDLVGLEAEARVASANFGDQGGVLLEEGGASAVVERRPERAVGAEAAEHQEVARRAPRQQARGHPDLGRRLRQRRVGGRVVNQRLGDGPRQLRAPALLLLLLLRVAPYGLGRGGGGRGGAW